ncbi:MAG: hypothetical protein QXJ74_05265 [Nitrososphaera sp.]
MNANLKARCTCGDTRAQHGGVYYGTPKFSGRCRAKRLVDGVEVPCWCLCFVGAG